MASPDALGTTAFDMIDAQCLSALIFLFRSSAGWVFQEPFGVDWDLGCSPS